MKKFFKIFGAIAPLTLLVSCANMPVNLSEIAIPKQGAGAKTVKKSSLEPLDLVELKQPKVSITFLDTNETFKSGDVFDAPKTIDCSKIDLHTNSYEKAIEAGALLVKLKTPNKIVTTEDVPIIENGKVVRDQFGMPLTNKKTETVYIKPVYGGVLALCDVSNQATGPDSRSYRIRGLDNWLAKGKDGFVSVVGAVLDTKTSAFAANDHSWILWLSDRSTIFTNYKEKVEAEKAAPDS